jgi:regulator of protease activity HflC (stomatin/prohibitin superfamily)
MKPIAIIVIEAGGSAVWEAIAGQELEVTDALWRQLAPQLEGLASQTIAEAQASAIWNEAQAETRAAIFVRQQGAYSVDPKLVALRMYLDEIGRTLAGKKKLILDGKIAGRRHLLLGVPGSLAPFINAAPGNVPPRLEPPGFSP